MTSDLLATSLETARYSLMHGDVLEQLALLPDNSVDSVVTDPPYGLKFMGKAWDSSSIENDPKMWAEVFRVLKPGGHLLSFGGSRTYHRMASAVEDAGFEIRDQIMWVYGSGFPKSMDVAKAFDKSLGVKREVLGHKDVGPDIRGNKFKDDSGERMIAEITTATSDQAKKWDGWGTALKPAHEPIVLARKPLYGTVVENITLHGVGAINIAASRIPGEPTPINKLEKWSGFGEEKSPEYTATVNTEGRFPANLIHDGSEEVGTEFAKAGNRGAAAPVRGTEQSEAVTSDAIYNRRARVPGAFHKDSGTAARFFYCAKANKKDREEGNGHPTVKPTDLMRYLITLITPPGGIVLDPFAGSSSTGKAALQNGFRFIGIEKEAEFIDISHNRLQNALAA